MTPATPTVSSRPCPKFAGDRDSASNGAVDIRELVWLNVTVSPAGADESAEIGCDLLLNIHAYATTALILADGGNIGQAAGDRCQRDRVRERSHTSPDEEPGDGNLANSA